MNHNNEIFSQLIKDAQAFFNQSKLKAFADDKRLKWAVSLCGTPISQGLPVILGINWGGGSAADSNSYAIQQKPPTREEFLIDYKNGDYRFLQRSRKLIMDHLKIDVSTGDFNYSNLCLFRSPDISGLTFEDVISCMPVIKKYIEFIGPPWILSLGNTNINYLRAQIPDLKEISAGGKSHMGYSGTLWGHPFYSLPHPNARLKNELRNAIWKNVFPG